MSSDSRHEDISQPETMNEQDPIKDGMFFPTGLQTPCLSAGHMNPFTGESAGRVVVDHGKSHQAKAIIRAKSSGQVGRVRAIHNRISELERSAVTMYTQHAGAAMALEREVAALREERLRLGDELGDIGNCNPRRQRPMSAPSNSSPQDKARRSWVLTSNPKLRQDASAEHLSKPVRRKTLEPSQKHTSHHHHHRPVRSASAQRSAAERLSRGDQARPHAWEQYMSKNDSQQHHKNSNQNSPSNKEEQNQKAKQQNHQNNTTTRPSDDDDHKKTESSPTKKKTQHRTPPVTTHTRSKSPARASFEKFVKQAPASPPNQKEQSAKMRALSSPSRRPREKVVTEGISKGSIDWIQYYGRQTPGPGQYEVDKASKVLIGPTGGRFSKAKPMSHVDVLMRDASKKPGPGAYKLKGGADLVTGGAFSTATPLTDVDRLAMEAKLKPGPGEYGPLLVDSKGRTMLGRGRTWSRAAPLSDVDILIRDASKKPGPGAYKLKGGADLVTGGAFSTASPLTEVDRLMLDSSKKPGPGEYGAPYNPRKDSIGNTGKFSTSVPMTEVDRLMIDAAQKPGPGEYGAPKKVYVENGGSGKFPFVYHPKDPKLAHLSKG